MAEASLAVCGLGRRDYGEALEIQYALLDRRQRDLIGDCLLLVEHPPVLTIGTRGDAANIYLPRGLLEEKGVKVYEVNRGGDVTYHGPGQVVGYPIMKIEGFRGGIRGFVSSLEDGIMALLREDYGIASERRRDKYTGVWVGDRKIAAIGVAIRRWTTMHGFALNVNTDLEHFAWINPCGLSMGVTSVQALLGREADFPAAVRSAGRHLAESLGRRPADVPLEELLPPG